MKSLFDWLGTRLGVVTFGAVLFICVDSGQDLLMSVVKAMLAFIAVRYSCHLLGGLTAAMEPEPGQDIPDNYGFAERDEA